jgi:2-C-methyl-D-erythritol 4-phosphate cytidylyltransferase
MTELEHSVVGVAETGAVGVVPTDGRGSMPFALLHGESLVAVTAWSLGHAGVELLDYDAPWSAVVAREAPLVVHDPLCPAVPVAFIAEAVHLAASSGAVVVGVRPVTDTVKELSGEVLGATVDRSTLVAVVSPVVLPPKVVAALDGWPDLDDVPAWVDTLRRRWPVTYLEAPASARRVADESDLRLLEAAEG